MCSNHMKRHQQTIYMCKAKDNPMYKTPTIVGCKKGQVYAALSPHVESPFPYFELETSRS